MHTKLNGRDRVSARLPQTLRALASLFACVAAALTSAGRLATAHEPHDVMLAVAASPNFAQDHTVLAAMSNFTVKLGACGLLRSADGGVTWAGVSGLPNNTQISAIGFSPGYSQDQTVFVGGSGGLWGTTDQGKSWKVVLKAAVRGLALSPNFSSDGTLFVVTTQRTILSSIDRGQKWIQVVPPAALTSGLSAIAVSPNYAVDKLLLLGSDSDGIFESQSRGAKWVQVTAGLTLSSVTALAFSPNYSLDHTAFAATLGSGFLTSTNAGRSWNVSNTGLTDLNVTSITFSPAFAQDSTLWVATASAGVFRSNSGGASWGTPSTVSRTLSAQTQTHYGSLVAAGQVSPTVLFLGMWEGLWISNDGASSWQYIDTIPTRLIRHINLSPDYEHDQTVFANTYGGGNLWSVNGGANWTFQNTGMTWPYTDASGFSPNYAIDGIAFSGIDRGLERTSNRGALWRLGGEHTYVRALAISPNFAQDSTLFIGTENGTQMPCNPQDNPFPFTGLYLSKDAGSTWIPTSLTRPASSDCWGVIGAAFSPAFAVDQIGFAGSPDGVYKSTDGGNNWTLLAGSPTQLSLVEVSPNFVLDQTIYAAGRYVGIFKSADGGSTWSILSQTSTLKAMEIQLSPDYAKDQSFFVATTQNGLLQFTAAGTNMTKVTSFPDSFVTAVGLSPRFGTDHTLFAAGYHGLYKSVDGGTSWTYTGEPARIEESRNVKAPAEQSPTVTYQGTWSLLKSNGDSTSAAMSTSVSGGKASLHFTGSGVRLVTQTGPSQGSISIQLDGVAQGTVSLTSPNNQYQSNVWEKQVDCGLHVLTITASTQAGQTVSLDAFDVWVGTCPLND